MSEYKFSIEEIQKNEEYFRSLCSHEYYINVNKSSMHIFALKLIFKAKVGEDWYADSSSLRLEYDEFRKGLISGVFFFKDQNTLVDAIDSLRLTLNEEKHNLQFSDQWEEFRKQFAEWFSNHLKPQVNSHIEIFNKYAKNTNN